MSSEIQFGDLEHSQPQRGLRPDQDAHFATATVGSVGEDELLIFVDLDVQRDMEAHALNNTRVELGGVMLGHQYIDHQDRPFVVISDSLRAEHYEATQGSFKFTHETWSQISRQREQFRPDLEMVGWYHTHPGWSVFLSGMDLFICNNFFNRPLDVALVIDPCEQDRGWFQWTQSETPSTKRTNGFVLTTNRFRQLELDQFARIYNKEPIMNMDPRYSGHAMTGAQPVVNLMENRKPVLELAVIGILVMQFLLFAALAWRMLATEPVADSADQQRIAELESKLEGMVAEQGRSMREEAYREVLSTLVETQTGDASLVDEFTQLKTETKHMQANLEGQLALMEKLRLQRDTVQTQLELKNRDARQLESQLVATRKKLRDATTKYELLAAASDADPKTATANWPGTNIAWWLAIGAVVAGLGGIALGFWFGRREGDGQRRSASSSHDAGFGKTGATFDNEDGRVRIVPQETESVS